jgi:hypothetical protein
MCADVGQVISETANTRIAVIPTLLRLRLSLGTLARLFTTRTFHRKFFPSVKRLWLEDAFYL